jgi:hypothetical protein
MFKSNLLTKTYILDIMHAYFNTTTKEYTMSCKNCNCADCYYERLAADKVRCLVTAELDTTQKPLPPHVPALIEIWLIAGWFALEPGNAGKLEWVGCWFHHGRSKLLDIYKDKNDRYHWCNHQCNLHEVLKEVCCQK